MKNRDKGILNDLKRFRCMSRDDIIALHFQGLKNAVTCCNTVMKRLRRDGHVDANVSQHPYIYFPQPSSIRKTSQKSLISLVLWTFTNNSFIMKILNYSKLNQSMGKNIWSRMLLQYGVDRHSLLKFKSQCTVKNNAR